MIFEITKKNSHYSLFAFWFAASFVLNGYSSGISGISLGSAVYIIMIIFSLSHILSDGMRISKHPIILGLVYIVITLFDLSNIHPISVSSIINSIGKLLVWALMICCVVRVYFDYDSILKWLIRFSIVLTVYLCIQTLAFNFFSIYLPNIFNVGFLVPYADGYADYDNLKNMVILRPASFLSESSFCGNYLICTLAMTLEKYSAKISAKYLFYVLFFTLGIILCTSTSAIVLLGLVWIVYWWKIERKARVYIMVVVGCIIASLPILSVNAKFQDSMTYAFEKFTYLNSSSRVGKSYGALEHLPEDVRMMGVGVGNDLFYLKYLNPDSSLYYVNSVTSILVQTGYLGASAFVIFILSLYYKLFKIRNTLAFLLLTLYIIKGFASGIYFSTYGIMFLSIFYAMIEYKKYPSSFIDEKQK